MDEEWQWVCTTPHHHHDLHYAAVAAAIDDDHDDGFFPVEFDGAPGPSMELLTTNMTQLSESLSSTASSPILKHSVAVTVMAKESISDSASEWIEPQLVFSKQQGLHFEGFEIYEVVTYLQNIPKAKEALVSLLSDPMVCDAVIRNKAFQELTYDDEDSDHGSDGPDLNSACTSSSLYKQGKKAYNLLKQKLTTGVDILFSLLGRHTVERNAVDQLDATVQSCILLVAILVFFVIGKRSNEGFCLERTTK